MKIYIACPIFKYVREGFTKDFVSLMESVYQICLEYSEDVYFPLKKEAFGQDKKAGSGEVSTPVDFYEVSKAGIIIVIPETSMGYTLK